MKNSYTYVSCKHPVCDTYKKRKKICVRAAFPGAFLESIQRTPVDAQPRHTLDQNFIFRQRGPPRRLYIMLIVVVVL